MGRYTGTPPQTPSTTSQPPIGAVSPVFRSGTSYKAVGEVVQRSIFAALSSAFPRSGAFASQSLTLPLAQQWKGIAYGNGVWVAVGDGANAAGTNIGMISYDGMTWQKITLPDTGHWIGVAYGGGLFVATVAGAAPSYIWTSPDGVNWTQRTSPGSVTGPVAYGGGMFVIASTSGTAALSSPDGITWTARTMPSSAAWSSITYGNGTFLAITSTGASAAATSTNGTTWTARTMPNSVTWWSATYGNGLFAAIGVVGTAAYLATSPDGATWTLRALPTDFSGFGSTPPPGIAYGNGVFIAVAVLSGGNSVSVTSYDGLAWRLRPIANASGAGMATCYNNGMFATLGWAAAGNAIFAEDLSTSDYLYLSGTTGNFVRVA